MLSVVAAVGALAMPQAAAATTPQTGIATSAPVVVSTCSVTDLYNSAISPEFGANVSYRMLGLTFTNTDDAVATQVTFDIAHDGTHTMVTDRGRFSRGARIEHNFDDLFGGYGSGGAQCAVVAVTFADGRRWTAPVMTANRADRTFHPDFSRALTVDQMNRAWQNELDRINPPVVTGGG